MGILNVTPDSFSDGGLFADIDKAVSWTEEMVSNGADIIDIGGESSRPGADSVSSDDEKKRVLPVIERLVSRIDIPISIDTCKAEVARSAIDLGVEIVNDVSGLQFDPQMADIIAKNDVYIVIMHMKGTPEDMQLNPSYMDVIEDIYSFFEKRIAFAQSRGIKREKIIIDPGIGFGKRTHHNLKILKSLERFKNLGNPILLGTSRKSFIGDVLNLRVDDRIEGTGATAAVGIMNGANILRVHDVKPMVRIAKMVDSILKA
ncbi:MAG: dihydropteroate synthase [Nitrospirota bacterium]